MNVMLRLDPSAPPLWRTGAELQFGVDAPVLTLTAPHPWQDRLVHELVRGLSEPGVEVWGEYHRVRRDDLVAFLRDLSPVLRRVREAVPPVPRSVAIELPRGRDEHPLGTVAARALQDDGWDVRLVAEGAEDALGADLVVLAADFVVASARGQRLLHADRPHLALVRTPHGIDVGPVVLPGASPCLHCVDLHRRERDDEWPFLALQLSRLRAPRPHARALQLAGAALLSLLEEDTPAGRIRTVPDRTHPDRAATGVPPLGWGGGPAAVDADGLVTLDLAAHPSCTCADAWARVAAAEVQLPPTSAERGVTELRRPA